VAAATSFEAPPLISLPASTERVPLTSEPPLADAAPLTSEPPLGGEPALTAESTVTCHCCADDEDMWVPPGPPALYGAGGGAEAARP
jgi:hypothetical protein